MPIIQLPPFQNVGAALTAVLPAINQGWTYEKIWFRLGGTTAAPQFLTMHFANPRALSLADRMIGAIDTSIGYSNFSLEVDIGTAVAPTLVGYAKVSAPIPKASGFQNMFRTLIKSALPIPAATEASVPMPLGSQHREVRIRRAQSGDRRRHRRRDRRGGVGREKIKTARGSGGGGRRVLVRIRQRAGDARHLALRCHASRIAGVVR